MSVAFTRRALGARFRNPLVLAAVLSEVKEYGGADPATTKRTAEQTEIAHFWANDLDGTYKTPGHLYALTDDVVETRWPQSSPVPVGQP